VFFFFFTRDLTLIETTPEEKESQGLNRELNSKDIRIMT